MANIEREFVVSGRVSAFAVACSRDSHGRPAGDSHGRSFPGPSSLVLTKLGRARCRGWRESRLEAAAGQRASGMCRHVQLGFRPACAASVESAHQSGCWLHSRLRFSWLLAPVHVSTSPP